MVATPKERLNCWWAHQYLCLLRNDKWDVRADKTGTANSAGRVAVDLNVVVS